MRKIDLPAFVAFCRAKPAKEQYNPSDASACAYFQFSGEVVTDLGDEFGSAVESALIPVDADYTFGALADRLETLIKEPAHA